MSNAIDKLTWAIALASRYPRLAARATFRDSLYRPLDPAGAKALYDGYQTWMRGILAPYGVYHWTANKGDCDFWSRLFIAYVLLRNVIGRTTYKPALAEIHFLTDPADPHSGHSVCSLLDADNTVYEIDPQPGCGLISLSDEQAATVRSFDA